MDNRKEASKFFEDRHEDLQLTDYNHPQDEHVEDDVNAATSGHRNNHDDQTVPKSLAKPVLQSDFPDNAKYDLTRTKAMEWECRDCISPPNKVSYPPLSEDCTGDQDLSSDSDDGVQSASVSSESHQGQEKFRCRSPQRQSGRGSQSRRGSPQHQSGRRSPQRQPGHRSLQGQIGFRSPQGQRSPQSQEQRRLGLLHFTDRLLEGCQPFKVNSVPIAIGNQQLPTVSMHDENMEVDRPPLQNIPVRRCGHMMLSVFLVTCCNASVCVDCAEKVMKHPEKCPFCGQQVKDGVKRVQ